MTKHKALMLAVARGGMSQSQIAASLHASKRDVSAAAKAVREHGLDAAQIEGMDAASIEERYFPKEGRGPDPAYLQPDLEALVARKKRSRKLPVKLMWGEYCDAAAAAGRRAYSYQAFCEMFSAEAERQGAVQHFRHEPGAKCYIDWAGDTASITDRLTGRPSKVYLIVVALPFSGRFWSEGFLDMKQDSWQEWQAHAFSDFGGVPRMLVPDNCGTATDRSPIYVTLVNREYERFAEHYGAAIVPARVRRPRDKSTSETAVGIVEQWIVAPAQEMQFHSLEEFNEWCLERVRWLNSRSFSAKEGSRDSVYEDEERGCMLPLPVQPYERCEWRSAKVGPDYHIVVDYGHYSVPHRLIGMQVDVRLTATRLSVMSGGAVVAEHPRLRGRKGQYSTFAEHMPESHRQESPWSRERFESWAGRVGPETGKAIVRLLDSRPMVEQAFVSCRNILGLSKRYSPAQLEAACGRINALGAVPSYTSLKNSIQQQARKHAQEAPPARCMEELEDRAKHAGHVRGADAWRTGGGEPC